MLRKNFFSGNKTPGLSALVFFFFTALNSCTKADVQYGSQLVGDQYSQIVMTDTFTVNVNTIFMDSIVTSATGVGLAGAYSDAEFGKITASSYYEFTPPTDFTDKNVYFDSLEVILKGVKTFYGDSLQPLSLNVYQLTSAITKLNSSNFYSYDSFPHSPSAIGSKTIELYPHITDTVSIRLSDIIGRNLLNLLQLGAEETSSTDNFINYFKGLYIAPGENNNLIWGFQDSIIMRLHYKETTNTIALDKTVDFTLNNSQHQFNHINSDKSGTALAALDLKTRMLSSSQTSNNAYVQPATNIAAKISIPYLRDLLNVPNYLKIERALLSIKPVAGTYTGFYNVPDSLRLVQTDKNLTTGSDITYSDGTVEYGSFSSDDLYGETTEYSYDVTTYLQSQIAVTSDNQNGLMVRKSSAVKEATDFHRLIFGDQQNPTNKITLQIYYLTVK